MRVDGLVLPYAVCNGCFKPVHYTPRDGTGGLRRHACPLTVAMSQAKDGGGGLTPTSGRNAGGGNKAAASPAGSRGASANNKNQQAAAAAAMAAAAAAAHGHLHSPAHFTPQAFNEDDSRSSRHRRFVNSFACCVQFFFVARKM